MGIPYQYVSRKLPNGVAFTYDTLTENDILNHQIIINCTPLGTFPNVDECPKIPYQAINKNHLLFDLIYNPNETKFLKLGKKNLATTVNGLNMLKLQAEKSWAIWNLR